ncbi:hypothetical protein [Streptomyces boninensis]|uniref:hypothetical protein n=1 Tax=Streptomyces boninensis TaxID=2039455 RepID=UPI003B21E6A0
MSHPPSAGSAAPPDQLTVAGFAAIGQSPPTMSGQIPQQPGHQPARRTAFAEGMDRMRTSATTEPGRLRIIGAVLAVLVVAFAAITAWQVADRSSAADSVVERSQPLSADAASIYRSLADADTTAAAGFLSGGQWPNEVTKRYEKDIDRASKLLVKAAANTEGSAAAQKQLSTLSHTLPRYTGLIEQARANNRQGLPLGGAYLRYANKQMSETLLPAARELYETETGQLNDDYDAAKSWPYLALAAGVVALGGLGWAQRRNYRRTNRVFNQGLLIATAATTVVLLWLVAGHAFARSGLTDSDEHGAQSLQVLNEARIDSLRARADESLTSVSRGAVVDAKSGEDAYEKRYQASMVNLMGKGEKGGPASGSKLHEAFQLADNETGEAPVDKAGEWTREWQQRHKVARSADDAGDYDLAVERTIGKKDATGEDFDSKNSSGEAFDKVDAWLAKALAHEQAEFSSAAEDGRGAFTGLQWGAVVLGLLGALGALLGIGRRLSEYR